MDVKKGLGIILLVAGTICLVYRGFTYTKETHDAKIGSLELSMKEKESVTIPVWLGVGLVVVGGALLVIPKRR